VSITYDFGFELLKETVNLKSITECSLPLNMIKLQNLEETIDVLNSLENVFGMLNELTPDQVEIFEDSVKRRNIFK
ncbi:hypothetical protein DRQ09_07125, partial [candidate division KSB1 bacterium]